MTIFLRAVWAIVWPPSAPVLEIRPGDDRFEPIWWATLCVALVIPFTAVWHHAVFYSPRCMLNDFGPDYTAEVVAKWLARDPSLPWAIVSAMTVYAAGLRSRRVRLLSAPLFMALLPLSIWIWDIPFTGRIVCHTGHDKRPLPYLGVIVRTRYLYLSGALIYVVLLVATLARRSPGQWEAESQPGA
jgi:hypothetical protein